MIRHMKATNANHKTNIAISTVAIVFFQRPCFLAGTGDGKPMGTVLIRSTECSWTMELQQYCKKTSALVKIIVGVSTQPSGADLPLGLHEDTNSCSGSRIEFMAWCACPGSAKKL